MSLLFLTLISIDLPQRIIDLTLPTSFRFGLFPFNLEFSFFVFVCLCSYCISPDLSSQFPSLSAFLLSVLSWFLRFFFISRYISGNRSPFGFNLAPLD